MEVVVEEVGGGMTGVSAPSATYERRGLATGATSLAVVLWSVGSTLAKSVDLPGQVLSMHRVAWAAVLYLAIVAARGHWPSWDKFRVAVPVGVCYALTNGLFFLGVKSTTVANATIIQCLQPIPIMLVANRLFGEPVRRREVLLSGVALGGVGLVVFGSATTVHWSPRGDLLSLGSLIAWVGYFVFTKQVRSKMTALELQAVMLPVATIVLVGLALAMGGSLSPGTPTTWAGIVAIIATAGTGHLLMSAATLHLPITEASLLTLGQPVVAVTLAAAFLDEGVVAAQVIGMVVVLAAMAGVVTARS
jgi:drug/metabolite transporter (DMT)-like permease